MTLTHKKNFDQVLEAFSSGAGGSPSTSIVSSASPTRTNSTSLTRLTSSASFTMAELSTVGFDDLLGFVKADDNPSPELLPDITPKKQTKREDPPTADKIQRCAQLKPLGSVIFGGPKESDENEEDGAGEGDEKMKLDENDDVQSISSLLDEAQTAAARTTKILPAKGWMKGQVAESIKAHRKI